jgi:hypothetical protein
MSPGDSGVMDAPFCGPPINDILDAFTTCAGNISVVLFPRLLVLLVHLLIHVILLLLSVTQHFKLRLGTAFLQNKFHAKLVAQHVIVSINIVIVQAEQELVVYVE